MGKSTIIKILDDEVISVDFEISILQARRIYLMELIQKIEIIDNKEKEKKGEKDALL